MVSSAFSHNSSTNLISPSQPIYFTSLSVSLYSYRNFISTSISSSHLIPILVVSNTTQIAQQNVHQDTFTPSSLSLSIISTGSIKLPLVSYHLLKAHLRISYPSLLRPFIWKVLFESLILQANILLPIHRSWRPQHQELQHKLPVRSNIAANSAGTKRRMYKITSEAWHSEHDRILERNKGIPFLNRGWGPLLELCGNKTSDGQTVACERGPSEGPVRN